MGVRVAAVALLACLLAASAADEPAEKITYQDHVQPIFRQHCFTCHSQSQAKSDLALDAFGAVIQGGASGAVVEPGDPDSSRLWMLVSHAEEPHMPPEQDKLPEEKLALIKKWIELGALENAGSQAAMRAKPKFDLSISSGAGRPDGGPVLPEGLSRQPLVVTPRPGAVTAMAASPWAPLVAIGGQKQILLYHSDSGELLGVLPFPEGLPHVLRFSRNGALLLAGGGRGGASGKVVVFDVKTGQRAFEVGDELDVVLAADINEDHTLIALGGPQRLVRVYSAADGQLRFEINKHTDWIYSVEFSPDGVLLATADRSGGLFVWEADTAREYQNLRGHAGAVNDLSWRLDSNVLASAGEDGNCLLWEMENGAQIKSFAAHGGGCSTVDFLRDGRLATGGRDRQIKLWAGDGQPIKAFEPMPEINLQVVGTHDGRRVLGGDLAGDVTAWDAESGAVALAFSANPPTLAQRAEQLASAAAEAEASAARLAAEVEALDAQVKRATASLEAANAQASAAQKRADEADAQQGEADAAAAQSAGAARLAEQAVAAAQSALAKAQAAVQAALQLAQQRAAAAKAAGETALAARQAVEQVLAEHQGLAAQLADKSAASRQAAEAVATARAAAQRAAAEAAAAAPPQTAAAPQP